MELVGLSSGQRVTAVFRSDNRGKAMALEEKPKRLKKVYCLRIRPDDDAEWSEPEVYTSRKRRDEDAAGARIIAGYRTHSFERYEK